MFVMVQVWLGFVAFGWATGANQFPLLSPVASNRVNEVNCVATTFRKEGNLTEKVIGPSYLGQARQKSFSNGTRPK
jgi:hypothetical protein